MSKCVLIYIHIWLCSQILTSVFPITNETAGVPINLYQAVNDSLTAIKLILDDTQRSIHVQQSKSIPTIVEMNYSIGEGGPFDAHLAISAKVFNRFVDFIDNAATQTSIRMTQVFLGAIEKVAKILTPFLQHDRVDRTIKMLKFVIFEIAPKIGKLTAENKVRYWTTYEIAGLKAVRLHTGGTHTCSEYKLRLDNLLDEAVRFVNRHINEVGELVDQFSTEVAEKLLDIIRESLNPCISKVGSTVFPWVNDAHL